MAAVWFVHEGKEEKESVEGRRSYWLCVAPLLGGVWRRMRRTDCFPHLGNHPCVDSVNCVQAGRGGWVLVLQVTCFSNEKCKMN